MTFAVVHVDDHVVVVHKDAGLLTTPAHGDEALIDLLDAQFFGRYRLAVVHRLDKLTSGLLVFARSPAIAAFLAKQFATHRVEREYVAIVAGRLTTSQGTLNAPLDGQRAVTHFTARPPAATSTTVVVRLETGRRNQIRRHFATAGHPLIGDSRFGGATATHPQWPHERIALHARVLGFVHPASKTTLRFEAPVPAAFTGFPEFPPLY